MNKSLTYEEWIESFATHELKQDRVGMFVLDLETELHKLYE